MTITVRHTGLTFDDVTDADIIIIGDQNYIRRDGASPATTGPILLGNATTAANPCAIINGHAAAVVINRYFQIKQDGVEICYFGNAAGNTGIINPNVNGGTILFGLVNDSLTDIDAFVYCQATVLDIGAPVNINFNIGFGSVEAVLTADNLTFNNGSNDTYFNWQLDGILVFAGGDFAVQAGTSATSIARVGGTVSNAQADVGNSGTTETDLATYTTTANTFASNGDGMIFRAGGTVLGAASPTRQWTVYCAGNKIFDTGAIKITTNTSWKVECWAQRVDSSTLRFITEFVSDGVIAPTLVQYTQQGSLTLSGTNILKLTGTAAGVGAATNDIIKKMDNYEWISTSA